MIDKFLDPYELKARIVPGLLLALAVLVDLVFAAPVLSSLPIFAATGICSLALVYFLGNFARARGRAIEPELWKRWGGPPSTRLLRHRDSLFGDDLKESVRGALVRTLSVRLMTADEEAKDSERADKVIVDAFRQVRQYLQHHDPDGLWQKQNIEYGFCRNLMGCRVAWSFLRLPQWCSPRFMDREQEEAYSIRRRQLRWYLFSVPCTWVGSCFLKRPSEWLTSTQRRRGWPF